MSRSLWKGPFSSLKKSPVSKHFNSNKQDVWCRNSMILPKDIGREFNIYNGKNWILRKITESMVGHKFGEFSLTNKRVVHKINKKRQMSKKK